MTAQDVEDLTSLSTRFVETDDDHMWLSCQIGKWHTVQIQVSKFKKVPERVFHLLTFGSSWEIAYKMFLKRE